MKFIKDVKTFIHSYADGEITGTNYVQKFSTENQNYFKEIIKTLILLPSIRTHFLFMPSLHKLRGREKLKVII